MKANCQKLINDLYNNPTQQNEVIIEPDDIHYDSFSVIHTTEEPIVMYVYSGSH